MKKVFISTSIFLSALFAFQSFAQTPVADQQNSEKKCDRKDCHQGDCRRMPDMFEGITLTADQQKKLDALREQCRQKNQENQKRRADDRRQMRRDRLNQIKSILTPEQYTTFLENAYVNDMPKAKAGRQGDRRKHDKNKDFKGKGNRGAVAGRDTRN